MTRWLRMLLLPFLCLPLLVTRPLPIRSQTPRLTVTVINVGQGDAILVKFPTGEEMLIDAGVPDKDISQRLIAYLRPRIKPPIEIVVVTHPDNDHIGGMPAVLRAFGARQVWESGAKHNIGAQRGLNAYLKRAGLSPVFPRCDDPKTKHRNIGKVGIDVLAPRRGFMAALLRDAPDDRNNSSIVLRLSYGQVSMLLTGDMEKAEREDIRHWPASTFLKVAHHGSYTGTDSAYMDAIFPKDAGGQKIAAISLGYGNGYFHPHG
ncbi:MAG TPA: MBL fold metallo-hydrolase, partial [Armatimonadota bacterium]